MAFIFSLHIKHVYSMINSLKLDFGKNLACFSFKIDKLRVTIPKDLKQVVKFKLWSYVMLMFPYWTPLVAIPNLIVIHASSMLGGGGGGQ